MENTAVVTPFDGLDARNARIIARFSPAERLLYRFSKKPQDVFSSGGYVKPTAQWTAATALRELTQEFPNFISLIRGKCVLDYGCGDGFQSAAMAREGAAFVLGVDIERQRLDHGRRMARGLANVVFAERAEGAFDIAISLNSFEHFPEPEKNLADLAASIAPGGKILITFGSPWLSPYGSHMNFFTHFPWVNVVFSEKTVFAVRRLYRDDASRGYLPGINKMTIGRFEKIVRASGLDVVSLEYKAVKNLPVLSHLPGIREFFINRVNCILTK
ncbi:MAG: class I SAM-dependent methyltransferase [Rhodospirillaceae bacterium]|nr:class I SAM-dependent methyltransferase [Rhodospirillaceae bacterium]